MSKTDKVISNKIDHLGELDGMRKSRAMYIGSTFISQDGFAPSGLTQLAQEVMSNSVDEYLTGFGDKITVTIHEDNSMTVKDFGRGMPKGETSKKTDFERVINAVTKPHSSGKWRDQYQTGAAGMHGIGIKAVNATSEYITLHVTVVNDYDESITEYQVKFHLTNILEKKVINHYKKDEIERINNNTFKVKKTGEEIKTGTEITFMPDSGPVSDDDSQPVFESIVWTLNDLIPRLEASSFINGGLEVELIDKRQTDKDGNILKYNWKYENGLVDYMEKITEHQDTINGLKESIVITGKKDLGNLGSKEVDSHFFEVNAVIKFIDDIDSIILSYANGVPTRLGGTHHNGFINGIVRAVIDFGEDKKLIKGKIDSKDVEQGLVAVFEVKIPNQIVQFDGQTKDRLSTAQARAATQEIVYENFIDWLYDHPKESKKIIDKINESKSAREAMVRARKNAKEAKKSKKNDLLVLSSKLKGASSRNPKEKELFITEGDSASNIKRDTRTQAIFPIRGKIKNAYDLTLSQALQNQEISTITGIIGGGIGPEFDVESINYEKVVMTVDPDPDGSHIIMLLLALFYKFFKPLIANGHLYYVDTPLYRATKYIKGKPHVKMYYSETEIDKDRKNLKGYDIQRYKGLGEMETDEAYDAITRTDTRKLVQVTLGDAEKASEIVKIMMGKKPKDVKSRAEWIVDNIDFDEINKNGGI